MAGNNEFFEALTMLEHERGITAEYLIEKIRAAIVIAVKKNYDVEDDNVSVEIDPATGKFNVALIQEVVADEDWENEHTQIPLSKAKTLRSTYQPGDRVITALKTKEFGRIAAQTAKHVIRQGIREAERSQQLSEIQSKSHDIVMATVTRVDHERGIVAVDMGKGGEAILPRSEQVPGETYTEGQQLQVYIIDVVSTERGPRVMISRTHPGLVKRLFELEVPEIFDGTVEVKAISREAGTRTKMAVASRDPNVNPVSACIGPRGDRVRPPRRPCGRCGGAPARREDRHRPVERGPRRLHRLGPQPRQGAQGGAAARRDPLLPGHRAGRPAEPGHRQQGPERPPVRPPDRLQHRHPARERLLRRGGGQARGSGLRA